MWLFGPFASVECFEYHYYYYSINTFMVYIYYIMLIFVPTTLIRVCVQRIIATCICTLVYYCCIIVACSLVQSVAVCVCVCECGSGIDWNERVLPK